MGNDMNEPDEWMENARPVHRVTLDAFYMDNTEVTVGQFKQFVQQSGYPYKENWEIVARHSSFDDHSMTCVN